MNMLLTPKAASQVVNGLIKESAASDLIDNWGDKNVEFEAAGDSFITHRDEYLKDGPAKIADSVWKAISNEADHTGTTWSHSELGWRVHPRGLSPP